MDRKSLSEAMVQEMAELFAAELTRAAPGLVSADLDGMEQRLQALGRRVFGRVVEHTVAVIAAAEPTAPPVCADCQRPMRLVDAARPRALQGVVGEYIVRRAYFVCAGCGHGEAPLDARLGLGPGALSPGLARAACRLGIEAAFTPAAEVLWETLGVDVPDESVRRISEGMGAVAEAAQQAAVAAVQRGDEPVPSAAVEPAGPILAVAVDGVQVHLEDGWHEMKVGVLGALGPATRTDAETGRTHLVLGAPSYCAGLETAEAFWCRVHAEACRRGLGTRGVRVVVVLGDGADWIWRYAAPFLAVGRVEVVEIVDIYHAYEHLWTVANAVFGAGSAAAHAWAEPLKIQLREKGSAPVLAALARLAPEPAADATDQLPGSVAPAHDAPPAAADPLPAAATDEVRKARGYFTTHAPRMDYPGFVAREFPIGSGAVESAAKTLVQQRAKGPGMRWSPAGAQHLITLRALHRSGHWRAFWRTHPQRRPSAAIVHPTPPPPARDPLRLAA